MLISGSDPLIKYTRQLSVPVGRGGGTCIMYTSTASLMVVKPAVHLTIPFVVELHLQDSIKQVSDCIQLIYATHHAMNVIYLKKTLTLGSLHFFFTVLCFLFH